MWLRFNPPKGCGRLYYSKRENNFGPCNTGNGWFKLRCCNFCGSCTPLSWPLRASRAAHPRGKRDMSFKMDILCRLEVEHVCSRPLVINMTVSNLTYTCNVWEWLLQSFLIIFIDYWEHKLCCILKEKSLVLWCVFMLYFLETMLWYISLKHFCGAKSF